jgi:hypothetical protein
MTLPLPIPRRQDADEQGQSSCHTQVADISRSLLHSPQENAILEAAYHKNSKPDKAERAQILRQVQMSQKEVQVGQQVLPQLGLRTHLDRSGSKTDARMTVAAPSPWILKSYWHTSASPSRRPSPPHLPKLRFRAPTTMTSPPVTMRTQTQKASGTRRQLLKRHKNHPSPCHSSISPLHQTSARLIMLLSCRKTQPKGLSRSVSGRRLRPKDQETTMTQITYLEADASVATPKCLTKKLRRRKHHHHRQARCRRSRRNP